MLLTSVDFLAVFPELASIDPFAIDTMLIRVNISQNGYVGLCLGEETQKLALLLHAAHLLVRTNVLDGPNLSTTQAIRRLENKNDVIEYQHVPGNPYDLESTPYGIELLDIIDSNPCQYFIHQPYGLPNQLIF